MPYKTITTALFPTLLLTASLVQATEREYWITVMSPITLQWAWSPVGRSYPDNTFYQRFPLKLQSICR